MRRFWAGRWGFEFRPRYYQPPVLATYVDKTCVEFDVVWSLHVQVWRISWVVALT